MSQDKQKISHRIAHFVDTFWADRKSRSMIQNHKSKDPSDIKFLEFPEAIIRYKIVGKGAQTLVLATDPPIVIEQYDELLRYLENDFRVIVFEIPGFGFSLPRRKISFDFTESNNLIARFLHTLNLGHYLLAFPCAAGYAAIDIANRFSELVKGVILIQTPAWEEEIKWKLGRDPKGILAKPVVGQLALQILKRKRAPQWIEAAIGRQEKLPEFIETTDRAFAEGACFCLASAFQNYLTETAPNLSAIKQPNIVFWGDADKSHRRTDKSSTEIYCPGAEKIHFEKAGHFPELEEPEQFSQKIKEWASSIE